MAFLGFLLLAWGLLAIAVGAYWEKRGRSFVGGLLVSFFFSPLLGVLIGLFLSPDSEAVARTGVADGDLKRCPHCAEAIRKEARVCRFCGRDQPAVPNASLDLFTFAIPTVRHWNGKWREVTEGGRLGKECPAPSKDERWSPDVRAASRCEVSGVSLDVGAACPVCGNVATAAGNRCGKCGEMYMVVSRPSP